MQSSFNTSDTYMSFFQLNFLPSPEIFGWLLKYFQFDQDVLLKELNPQGILYLIEFGGSSYFDLI